MRAGVLALFLIFTVLACAAQTAPVKMPAQVPDSILYDAFLYRAAWIDDLADKLTTQGKVSAVSVRSTLRRQAGLTSSEDAALRDIAKDWKTKNQAFLTAAKVLAGPGANTDSLAVQNLVNQRQQAALSSMSQLQIRFGAARFQTLDAFIRKTVTVSPVRAGNGPASSRAK